MSLAIIYKDELVTDKRCVMLFPHALGHLYTAVKSRIAKSKQFAFAVVGPTMSEKELNLLDAILQVGLETHHKTMNNVLLDHEDFFARYKTMSLYVMTKEKNYHLAIKGELNTGFSADVAKLRNTRLIAIDKDHENPIGGGTGFMVASIAALEGMPMKDITKFVSKVVYTVSPEYDMIHRRQLKGFKK